MRRFYSLFAILFAALTFHFGELSAQRYVDVPPGRGTLNAAIAGDTLGDGSRNDPENTIYRLQRGPEAIYLLEGSISNSGFPLTIMAEEGDGARPFLQPALVEGESSRAFRPRGDLKLTGLHVTNLDELGGLKDRILRCSEDNIRIVAEDCWFDKDSQSLIRTDNPGQSYFLKNCVISNIGEPLSPDNGRGVDDRGNDIDTVWFENCTWYNLTSRVIRDDGGIIKFAYINHNTIMNVGQMGITFGPIDSLVLTNNLMINAGFMPKDEESGWVVLSADSIGDKAPGVTVAYNSAYLDSTKVEPYLNDTLSFTPFMNPTLAMAVYLSGMAETNHNLDVAFNDGPPFNDSMVIYHYTEGYDPLEAPFWEEPDIPGVGEGGNGVYHLDVPYDFGYVNRRARIAAMDGQLGDKRWTAENEVMGLVDFEVPSDIRFWNQFGNDPLDLANMQIVPNPDPSGINTSAFVMKYTVLDGAQTWAGAWSDVNGTMTFTEEKHHMEIMVWKDIISNCGLKVEQGGTTTELKVPNTKTGEWELVTFDFSNNIGETLTRLVFFPDFPDARTAGSTSYVDNIRIVTEPVGVDVRESARLRVYPNPATGTLTVQQSDMTAIMIRDILGKTVRSLVLNGEDHATLEIGDLAEGVYFITVESDGSSLTTKFLKR